MALPDRDDPFDVAALLGDRPFVDARSPPTDPPDAARADGSDATADRERE